VLARNAGEIQSDFKLLSVFPFVGHGHPGNNLESSCRTGAVSNGGVSSSSSSS
jgi:hypothetical protein